jgi:glycosyltransferase involved in cell wall biosynthesis
VLYHPDGGKPDWLPFAGETRPLAALAGARHRVLLCGEPSLLPQFEAAAADAKLFYCVLEKLPQERRIVRHPGWTILVNSTGLAERLWRRHRVRAVPAIGGIDLQLFHPQGPERPLRPEPLRVLAYGRLSRRRKGTDRVVRAAELLARRMSRRYPAWAGTLAHPVQLVLFDHVGPGNETDPRTALHTTLPVEFHLNLPQAELAALYTTCDVFVSAERRAGWNNTVAEAMACGVPVVCTTSGTRDLAVHRDTAWVVRWRHPWFLAAGLAALARDRELRTRLRRQALERVASYSWESVADRVESTARQRLGDLTPVR